MFILELTNMDQLSNYRVVFQLDPQKMTYKEGTATFDGTTRAEEWESISVNDTILNNLTRLEVTGTSKNILRQGRGTLFSFVLKANASLDQEDLLAVRFDTEETKLNGGSIIYDHEDWIGFTPFLWGDVNQNGRVGALDASFILQSMLFETELPVQQLQNYTRIEGTELPLLADVDNDQNVGVNDASLIQDHYTFITDHFEQVDTNTDNLGPDITPVQNSSAKMQSRNQATPHPSIRKEKLTASIQPVSDNLGQTIAWKLLFSVENAENIRGIFLALSLDQDHLAFPENGVEALVNSSTLLLSTVDPVNNQLKIVCAFSPALSPNDTTLFSVKLNKLNPAASDEEPIFVTVDHEQTQFNDGGIPLHPESIIKLNLSELSISTNVLGWMLY